MSCDKICFCNILNQFSIFKVNKGCHFCVHSRVYEIQKRWCDNVSYCNFTKRLNACQTTHSQWRGNSGITKYCHFCRTVCNSNLCFAVPILIVCTKSVERKTRTNSVYQTVGQKDMLIIEQTGKSKNRFQTWKNQECTQWKLWNGGSTNNAFRRGTKPFLRHMYTFTKINIIYFLIGMSHGNNSRLANFQWTVFKSEKLKLWTIFLKSGHHRVLSILNGCWIDIIDMTEHENTLW